MRRRQKKRGGKEVEGEGRGGDIHAICQHIYKRGDFQTYILPKSEYVKP